MKRLADKMVTMAKDGSLAARRRAAAVVRGDGVLSKLFSELAGRYEARAGGFTRVLMTRRRIGDAAQMAYIEYIDRPVRLLFSQNAACGFAAFVLTHVAPP